MEKRSSLKQSGLKVTLPRLKILEIFEQNSEKHLSAEDIYKESLRVDEDIRLATIYRVLTQFESSGLVKRHHFEGGHSLFELDDGGHHDHMICVETGKVIEYCNDEIELLQEKVAKEYNYEIIDHNLTLYVRPIK